MLNSPVCCDTSLLFSLYYTDAHTPRADVLVRQLGQPLTISVLNEFDLANALRLSEFRKSLPPGEAAVLLAGSGADIAAGRFDFASCPLSLVITEARRLSATHTLSGGHRGFDILHVAVALCVRAAKFLSFDAKQRALAAAEGLTVLP